MSFSKTESGERILFVLTEEDAQFLAEQKFNRKLTDGELEQTQKGLEFLFAIDKAYKASQTSAAIEKESEQRKQLLDTFLRRRED